MDCPKETVTEFVFASAWEHRLPKCEPKLTSSIALRAELYRLEQNNKTRRSDTKDQREPIGVDSDLSRIGSFYRRRSAYDVETLTYSHSRP